MIMLSQVTSAVFQGEVTCDHAFRDNQFSLSSRGDV